MKKYLFGTLAALLLVGAAGCGPKGDENALQEIVDVNNKLCPQDCGNGVMLAGLALDKANKNVEYDYECAAELTREQTEQLNSSIKQMVLSNKGKDQIVNVALACGYGFRVVLLNAEGDTLAQYHYPYETIK